MVRHQKSHGNLHGFSYSVLSFCLFYFLCPGTGHIHCLHGGSDILDHCVSIFRRRFYIQLLLGTKIACRYGAVAAVCRVHENVFTQAHFGKAISFLELYGDYQEVIEAGRVHSPSDLNRMGGKDSRDPFERRGEQRHKAIESLYRDCRKAIL